MMVAGEVVMKVELRSDIEQFVAKKVRSGQYRSTDEAVNALLAALMEQDRLTPEDIADLRAEVDPAIAEADRGEFVAFTAEDIISEGRWAQGRKRVVHGARQLRQVLRRRR
jgi:putative addiction module CopG family antidote